MVTLLILKRGSGNAYRASMAPDQSKSYATGITRPVVSCNRNMLCWPAIDQSVFPMKYCHTPTSPSMSGTRSSNRAPFAARIFVPVRSASDSWFSMKKAQLVTSGTRADESLYVMRASRVRRLVSVSAE